MKNKNLLHLLITLAWNYPWAGDPLNNTNFWNWYVKTPKLFRYQFENYAIANKENILVVIAVKYYFDVVKKDHRYLSRWK
jgi:hypothetical protein